MQNSYSIEHGIGYPGMRATSSPCRCLPVRNNTEDDLPFGEVVVRDDGAPATAFGVKRAALVGDVVIGVSVNSLAHAPRLDGKGANGAAPNDMFDAMADGDVYVTVADAVKRGDPVFYGYADAVGKWRSSASPNFAQLVGARFESFADADGVAILHVNMIAIPAAAPAGGG